MPLEDERVSDLELIATADGSDTLRVKSLDETYHSRHGAVQESMHVFIKHGLEVCALNNNTIAVFEMGFGTGLNAWLTLRHAVEGGLKVVYFAVEKYPLSAQSSGLLADSFCKDADQKSDFLRLHQLPWNGLYMINDHFSIHKIFRDVDEISLKADFDLIYYDAFGPRVQPNMWTTEKLQKSCDLLKPGGLFVTYCAQGQFRRNLSSLGFIVESLQGPPGKREMTRAVKKSTDEQR